MNNDDDDAKLNVGEVAEQTNSSSSLINRIESGDKTNEFIVFPNRKNRRKTKQKSFSSLRDDDLMIEFILTSEIRMNIELLIGFQYFIDVNLKIFSSIRTNSKFDQEKKYFYLSSKFFFVV